MGEVLQQTAVAVVIVAKAFVDGYDPTVVPGQLPLLIEEIKDVTNGCFVEKVGFGQIEQDVVVRCQRVEQAVDGKVALAILDDHVLLVSRTLMQRGEARRHLLVVLLIGLFEIGLFALIGHDMGRQQQTEQGGKLGGSWHGDFLILVVVGRFLVVGKHVKERG